MNKIVSLAFGAALALSGSGAEASSAETAIRARMAEINPDAKIISIKPTPLAGVHEVIAGGQILYLSADANFLISGSLFDIAKRQNLTERAQATVRQDVLKDLDRGDMIIYSPAGEVKHSVFVFTDTSCGYCKTLHQRISDYNAAGIEVRYVAFPRGGERSPAFNEMALAWCSADRNAAYDQVIAGTFTPGTSALTPECQALVRGQYALGDQLGIQGTPTIFSVDGQQLGGFVPPDQLLSRLEGIRAQASVASASVRKDSGS